MMIAAWAVGAPLLLFTARRWLFWVASLLPRRPVVVDTTASITVLVAAHNEATLLPALLAALDRVDYPAALLGFVLVSDGSTDATPGIATEWCARTPRAQAVILPQRGGKAAALQAGWRAAPPSDLIVVLDADVVPAPGALGVLAGAFADARVGGVCGFPDPGRDHPSLASRYAALERWVSHLVTFAGKDRLGWQPPVIGAVAGLRGTALAQIGGFPCGAVAEDIELSLRLSRAGWRTRWLGAAVAREQVPAGLAAFRRQRLRWSRGLMATAPSARRPEDWLVSAGYIDRPLFALAVVLALHGDLPAWVPALHAATPLLAIATALSRARPLQPWRYLLAIAPMALVDLWLSIEAAAAQLAKTSVVWRR